MWQPAQTGLPRDVAFGPSGSQAGPEPHGGANGGRPASGRIWVVCALTVWCLLVLGSLFVLWRYEHAPGTDGRPPAAWPSETRLPREPGRPTLLLFAHPRCPCTRASLRELDRVLTLNHAYFDVHVLFLKPSPTETGWEQTDLWDVAGRMPGVHVWTDVDGREAALFRARTSGAVVIYDARGRLAFAGGLTISRGHEGPSAGGDAVRRLVLGETRRSCNSDVFGCPLFADRVTPPAEDQR